MEKDRRRIIPPPQQQLPGEFQNHVSIEDALKIPKPVRTSQVSVGTNHIGYSSEEVEELFQDDVWEDTGYSNSSSPTLTTDR